MSRALIQRVVHVTPELIAQGVPLSEHRCPVALALRPLDSSVEVNQVVTSFHVDGVARSLRHDEALATWIFHFDFGQKVEPIDVALDLEERRLWIVPSDDSDLAVAAAIPAWLRSPFEDSDLRDQLEPRSVLDLTDEAVGL